MDTNVETLNPESAPSTDSTLNNPGSAPSADSTHKQEADSSPDSGAKEPGSLAEALAAVKLEQPGEETPGAGSGEEQQSEESPTTDKPDATETDADEPKGEKDEPPAGEGAKPEAGDAHFHARPEWQDAVKLGGDKIKPILRKLFGREAQLNQQVDRQRQELTHLTELKQYTGDDTGFNQLKHIVRAYANDPAAAVPILEKMLADSRQRAGFELSSDDLKAQAGRIDQLVSDGLMDESTAEAQRKILTEAERARAGHKQATSRLSEQERAQAHQQQERELASINAWEESIRQLDADFGQVTDVDDPNHGVSVADQVFDAMCIKRQARPDATVADLLNEAKRAYRIATERRAPKVLRQQRVITSHSSSSPTAKPAPRSVREAMDNVRLS